ncbi:MAG: glycoside hydrolase domain-containing protein [bacterium]
MKKYFLKSFLLALCVLNAGAVFAQNVSEYRHPSATVPYAWVKPVIDGKVDDAEWQGAFSQSALQTVNKQISSRQTRYWMMWDEENIYVAMRDPLRPGERPIQRYRNRDRDLDIIYDDCYEIWVSVDATDPMTGQLHCSTQFLSNFSGARCDALHQPAVGNSRTSSYDTNWEPKNRITDKNEWEMEIIIPRSSLGTTKKPFYDGMHFRTLIAKNYKRPWEQNSFEGTSSFSVIDTHSEFIMSKSAPALHLLNVGSAVSGNIGLVMKAKGQADCKVHWQFMSNNVNKQGDADIKKGMLSEIINLPEIDKTGPGKVRITLTGEDGNILLDWSALRMFSAIPKDVINDSGDRVDLGITFNPEKDYARVFGDFINYDNRKNIRDITIIVNDANGKEIKRSTTRLDDFAYAKDILHFDKLAMGKYTVSIECKDAAGNVLVSKDSTFTKEDLAAKYEWWNTKRGNIEKVISPWTPVTINKSTFGVWGREMEFGPAGLPVKVSTQGNKILAAPGKLTMTGANGKAMIASGVKSKTIIDRDYRKTVVIDSKIGNIDISSEVKVEFDGMYKVRMTLTPVKPTSIKNMKIVLPYTEAMAEYIHAVTAEIRSGFFYGFTPAGKGRVWDCYQVGDKTMKSGSFIPYIWLGSPKGGLCWFADSDQGWIPNDKVPAIEIQRNVKGQVDLVFNIISNDAVIDQPRTITFGLQASPVKQMHKGWREDNWWCGDTFKQYAHSQNLIFASTPFVLPGYIDTAKKIVDEQHKAGKPAVPYFIHTSLPGYLVPEMNIFAEQWKTTVDDALCYRGSFNDYMIHNWSKWAETCGIDGYYIDNMRPIACDNIEHGCGYKLPDGRIQPTFQMFDTRDYFLRSRAAFLEQRPESRLVLHMTNSMVIPWVCAADVSYDGEHHVIYPEMKKDFMDFWSLERMRVDFPSQWGVAVNFMHEYQGDWNPIAMHLGMRAYFATVMLHDALPTGNENGHARMLTGIRKKFGIGDDNVKFLPYWEKTGISSDTKDIKLAAWHKPDKMLLMVANFGEQQDVVVNIDAAKLGWKDAVITVSDTEKGMKRTDNIQVDKTDDEINIERTTWEANETKRIATLSKNYDIQLAASEKAGKPAPVKPDLTPKPFKEQRKKNVNIITWNGDDVPAPELHGNIIKVFVPRHNYRLLIIEKK